MEFVLVLLLWAASIVLISNANVNGSVEKKCGSFKDRRQKKKRR